MKGLLFCVPLYTLVVLLLGLYMTAGVFVLHVAVVPAVFKYSKTFRRKLIFANFVNWPLFANYEDPAESGARGGRNLNIQYESKVDNCPVKIGVWHILPKSACDRLKGKLEIVDAEELNRLLDEELINTKTPIFIYCHGNSGSRAASHRIELYNFFQKMDFHTIAFDYRGYGDSTIINPSENGVVEDSLMVYNWLWKLLERRNDKQGNVSVFVWGHSLGTGISSHLLGNLKDLCDRYLNQEKSLPLPNGLILESPFSNLADEVAHHPLAKLVQWLPYFNSAFVTPFQCAPEHTFTSDQHLVRQGSLPILILHSKDDVIVPYDVGFKLYETIKQSRGKNDAPVILHSYGKESGLGHKWICRAEDLDEVVGKFVAAHH